MISLKRLFSLGSTGEYEKGIAAYNRYQYLEAISHFENVMIKGSTNSSLNRNLARFYCAQAHRNIGIIRFAAANYTGSLAEFNNAIKLNKEHKDLYYFIGICHNNLQNYTEAAKAFDELLKVDPDHIPSRFKLAITFHNLEMWKKSVSLYQTILEQNPGYADVHYHLGLAFLGEGSARDALAAFKEALFINPNYLEARVKYCLTQTYLGAFDEALPDLVALIEKYPGYPDLHYYVSVVLAARNEIPMAIEHLKKSIEINPKYYAAKVKLALLYCKEGKFSSALNELSSVEFKEFTDQDLESAKRVLRSILDGGEKDTDGALNKLVKLLGGGQTMAEIIGGFNKNMDISLNFSEMVSLVEKHTGSTEEDGLWEILLPLALEHIRQHPEYADLYNTIGMLHLKLSRIGEAEDAFLQAVTINPNYVKARINLFNTLKKQAKYKEAEVHGTYLTETLKINYPDIVTAVGNVLFDLASYAEALDKAMTVIEEKPDYAPAILLSAQAFVKLDRNDDAIAAYQRFLKLNTDSSLNKQAEEALSRLQKI